MGSKKFKAKAEPVQVKKEKKPSSGFFRRLFASLFNNRVAFDSGRHEPWWIAALLFMLSIVIAIVPVMVQIGKTKGSDSLNGNLYHTDFGLVKFAEALNENDVDLLVKQDAVSKKRVMYEKSESNNTFAADVATSSLTVTEMVNEVETVAGVFPYFGFTQPRTTATNTVDFDYLRVYYTGNLTASYKIGTTSYKPEDFLATKLASYKSAPTDALKNKITSHLIIGRDSIYLRIYNPNEILSKESTVISYQGNIGSLPVDMNLRSFALKNEKGDAISPANTNYSDEIIANFANMQNLAYKDVKTQSFWLQTSVYMLIYTLIGLVMGLVIFVSTRGKHNPNRELKFFESIKIGAWLLPTPALLTLVVGLIMPSMFQMVFIMGIGLRSVWLTMRTLNPRQ